MGVEDYNKKKIEGLRDFKVAFDQEAMWADMQEKKKKRRGAFFFFTMALVALAIVFFILFYSGIFSADILNSNNIDHKSNIEVPANILEEDAKSSGEAEIRDAISNEDSELAVNMNETQTIESDLQASKIGLQASSKITYQNTDNNITSTNTVNNRVSGIRYDQNIVSDSRDQSTVRDDRRSTKTQDISSSESNQISSREINGKSETQESGKQINIEALDKFDFPYLDFDRTLDSQLESLKMNASPITKIESISKPKFLIGMYAGIGSPSREVSSRGELLTDLGDETLEEISAGLELKYNLRPNLYVRGGVEYSHITDRRTEATFEVNNLQDVEDVGALGFQKGDVGIVLTTTRSVEHTIYQSYNVPVLLGWNTRNEKFNFFAEVGAMVNIRNGSRGILPSFEGSEFILGSTTQISPIAGIGASYQTRNGMEFFLRSNWKASQYVTNARENVEGQVSQKYSSLRLEAGVRYGF